MFLACPCQIIWTAQLCRFYSHARQEGKKSKKPRYAGYRLLESDARQDGPRWEDSNHILV